MHNTVLLRRSTGRVESFKNIKSLDAAQGIVNRRGKKYFAHSYEVIRFHSGVYHDSDNKEHQLKV